MTPKGPQHSKGTATLVPRTQMCAPAVKLRDTYQCKPDAPFYHKTFGLWMCLDTWYEQGLDRGVDLNRFCRSCADAGGTSPPAITACPRKSPGKTIYITTGAVWNTAIDRDDYDDT